MAVWFEHLPEYKVARVFAKQSLSQCAGTHENLFEISYDAVYHSATCLNSENRASDRSRDSIKTPNKTEDFQRNNGPVGGKHNKRNITNETLVVGKETFGPMKTAKSLRLAPFKGSHEEQNATGSPKKGQRSIQDLGPSLCGALPGNESLGGI